MTSLKYKQTAALQLVALYDHLNTDPKHRDVDLKLQVIHETAELILEKATQQGDSCLGDCIILHQLITEMTKPNS